MNPLTSKARVAGLSGALLVVALALHLLGEGPLHTLRDAVLIIASLLAGTPIAVSAWPAVCARPTTSNRRWWARITSSAWVPMDPVEPRTMTRRIRPA